MMWIVYGFAVIGSLGVVAIVVAAGIWMWEMKSVTTVCEKCSPKRGTWLPKGPHICGRCGRQFVEK